MTTSGNLVGSPMSTDKADFKQYLEARRQLVEAYLNVYFGDYADCPPLAEAMTYSLEAGGKRLRPILCLAAYEAAGGKRLEDAVPVAAALECIHTYSLIHDDLPAMDDDDLRRGKPTSHKVFGEATAILAGDGLLTEAFKILARPGTTLPAEAKRAIIERIADAAGGRGMVGGQLFDMRHEKQQPTLDSLRRIHTLKTGRLLTAAVEVGALAAGTAVEALKPFTDYGYHLGFAFQIVDDVLDVTGGAELGKTPKSDLKQGKATFVTLLGVEASRRQATEEITRARAALAGFDNRAARLLELADYVLNRAN